ncbi:hypothetical protein BRC87_04465 [Halobacteriales archaeon QS_4_66_20]|nr:MAG: hypothetical protein BRC87_04465 [Halobacteriales archaeon QS_4_66_20]
MLGNASQERCPAGCSTGRRHRADEASDNSRADEQRSGNAEQVGPSGGLPEQVPDHVSEIHETIESAQAALEAIRHSGEPIDVEPVVSG